MNMKQDIRLTDEEKQLMEQYGISCERRTLYFFEGYKYEKLQDAIRYAKVISERDCTSIDDIS